MSLDFDKLSKKYSHIWSFLTQDVDDEEPDRESNLYSGFLYSMMNHTLTVMMKMLKLGELPDGMILVYQMSQFLTIGILMMRMMIMNCF
jgi:hypothetical protein